MKNWPDEEKAGRAKEEKIKKEEEEEKEEDETEESPHGEKERIMKGGLVRKMTKVKNNLLGWNANYIGGHGKMGKV